MSISRRARSQQAEFSKALTGKGSAAAGFDFTFHMRRLCDDIVRRSPEMRHIDLDRVAISFSQARKRVSHGLQATLTPLRFEGGARVGLRRGRRYAVQRVLDEEGREMLYILSFYLPRFLDADFREKLITIFHELWHISPQFDGDLRRHPGRCYAHTGSQENYDAEMAAKADRWLALAPPRSLYRFLEVNFSQLERRHGRVYGVKISHPKLLPVD